MRYTGMDTLIRRAAWALLLAAALPLYASAAPANGEVEYTTTLTPLQATAPYTGVLKLTYATDGSVRGYYFSSDYSLLYVPVVGGVSGNSIWLDIGSDTIMHVQGHISGGTITGGTAGTSTDSSYSFSAVPAAGVPAAP